MLYDQEKIHISTANPMSGGYNYNEPVNDDYGKPELDGKFQFNDKSSVKPVELGGKFQFNDKSSVKPVELGDKFQIDDKSSGKPVELGSKFQFNDKSSGKPVVSDDNQIDAVQYDPIPQSHFGM